MKLFIGSGNPGKISDWRDYFPAWKILSYEELRLDKIEVEEGIVSLEDNARNKAAAWAMASGELTLSDDTGFFINALKGFPGVSVKRWGGRFEKEMSHLELLRYLRKEIEGLDDVSCYFESAYAVADPSGKVLTFLARQNGRLDRSLLGEDFQDGFSFGAIFKADRFDKTWKEMTIEEKREVDRGMIEKIKETVQTFVI